MKQKVNYIVHHKEAFLKLMEEDVTAIDISIYNTLFLLWNNAEFDDKLSINRNEIMMMSKVGNANTYTKSLRKLDELGFIKYFPSNNPMRGSIITMCRFDNSSDNSTEHSSGNTCDYSSDNSTEHSGDTLYKPYKLYKPINSINNKNKDSSLSENSEKHNSLKTQEEKKEKSSAKKEKALSEGFSTELRNSQFFKNVCEFFSQKSESLQMKVIGRMISIAREKDFEEFRKQTKAYMDYKNQTGEKVHRFQNFSFEWDQDDWIDKFKKLNQTKTQNGNAKSESDDIIVGRVNVTKTESYLESRRRQREMESARTFETDV